LQTLDQAPVLVVAGPDAPAERTEALRAAGAEILVASGATPSDRIETAVRMLGRREVTSLFLEGGAGLASAFVEAGEVDECRAFVAPLLLAGAEGARRTGPIARREALASSTERVGDDTLITARFREW
jgi:diaminohydroxyphosphoribosylaminopyrimidine deaminase/5-amino-6-(5-phosphoribosylamino)uracil reductase